MEHEMLLLFAAVLGPSPVFKMVLTVLALLIPEGSLALGIITVVGCLSCLS
jgi:hypothetical protein